MVPRRSLRHIAAHVVVLAAASVVVAQRPSSANCTTTWFENLVDHFSAAIPPENGNRTTWSQRVLVCDQFFSGVDSGAIFFYAGNEGDVELYANHTGLMWENAAAFGALLVFAEHRYYGQSWPLGGGDPQASQRHMQFLSSQQALADYAVLLRSVKRGLGPAGEGVPAIAFGGSYGGVLSAMLRLKYPGAVAGAISASAPLRAFPSQLPAWDSAAYYRRITDDASAPGGSPDACAANVASLWAPLFADAASEAGRARLGAGFRTCTPLQTADDGVALAFWVRGGFDALSMGNYPYASDYITGGGGVMLPAYPVRAACAHLATPLLENGDPSALYAGVREAVAVLANATGSSACFIVDPNPYTHPAAPYDGIWDYQQCTEFQPDSQWFAAVGGFRAGGGGGDMFWPLPYNASFLVEHCAAAWGVTVTEQSRDWVATAYDLPLLHGGGGGSNVLFSSGEFDPWGAAALQQSPDTARGLVSLAIPGAAHHLDLMFADAADPPAVTAARAEEIAWVARWVTEARAAALRASASARAA